MSYLIVGLGNIGAEYEKTRHNIGFMVVDFLAKQFEVEFKSSRNAHKAEISHRGRKLILIKPTTYMNLSGKAVKYHLKDNKIPKERLLIVTDDISMDFGMLRLRAKGSAGGHNGLKDIIEKLGGQDFARLKIGVGDNFSRGRQADYVLSEFEEEEQENLDKVIERSADAALDFSFLEFARLMSAYNGSVL